MKDLVDELVKHKDCVTRLRPEPYEKYSISMENNGTIVDLGPATILKIID
ncbi:BC1881 family protein [Clostridium botulinum]|nr:BC1881 family protein [Clostridium botulinum]